ncbi:MAG: hypothetical protein RLZZ09_1235, partial [Pseudomonadota bacterium]
MPFTAPAAAERPRKWNPEMRIEVLVPNLPESVSDATLLDWHYQAGESVTKDASLIDLE